MLLGKSAFLRKIRTGKSSFSFLEPLSCTRFDERNDKRKVEKDRRKVCHRQVGQAAFIVSKRMGASCTVLGGLL